MNFKILSCAAAVGAMTLTGCTFPGETVIEKIEHNGEVYFVVKVYDEDTYHNQTNIAYGIKSNSSYYHCTGEYGDWRKECRRVLNSLAKSNASNPGSPV